MRSDPDWEDVPKGLQKFGGILFDVSGTMLLRSSEMPHLKERHGGIPVKGKYQYIHILHGIGYADPVGTEVARMELHYADGETSFDRLYSTVYPRLPMSIAARLEMPNPARDAQLRYRAALILYYLGEDARRAAPALVKALDDSDTEVRRVAANALGNFKDRPGATEALRLALADPHDSVRGAALQSLSHVEHGSVVALEAGRLLADPKPGVRIDAAQLLKNLGPEAKPAIPALIEALQDENADVLRFAAQALGSIGPEARAAVPGLIEVLEEDRPYADHGPVGVEADRSRRLGTSRITASD
ncbi:MAG TPA: HEAT repeat domain-containing protein [Methylomirabilota bacterium]|nr:HEAT repeat domain-containing protein [Methylomirabilota bacterium]